MSVVAFVGACLIVAGVSHQGVTALVPMRALNRVLAPAPKPTGSWLARNKWWMGLLGVEVVLGAFARVPIVGPVAYLLLILVVALLFVAGASGLAWVVVLLFVAPDKVFKMEFGDHPRSPAMLDLVWSGPAIAAGWAIVGIGSAWVAMSALGQPDTNVSGPVVCAAAAVGAAAAWWAGRDRCDALEVWFRRQRRSPGRGNAHAEGDDRPFYDQDIAALIERIEALERVLADQSDPNETTFVTGLEVACPRALDSERSAGEDVVAPHVLEVEQEQPVSGWKAKLAGDMDREFWLFVVRGVLSSLIAAWVIFLVGSTVAVAAVGGAGAGIGWAQALACALFVLILGFAIAHGFRAALELLDGTTQIRKRKRWLWVVSTTLVGVLAAIGFETLPGWEGVVGFVATLVVMLVAVCLFTFVPEGDHRVLVGAALWLSVALSFVCMIIMGVSVGVIIARATS